MHQEKRGEARCGLDDEVHLLVEGQPAQGARVMDVSAHGLRIRHDEALAPGLVVGVELDFLKADLPDHTVAVQARVMHRFREPGGVHWQVGLKLLVDDPVQERSLLGHLASCRHPL